MTSTTAKCLEAQQNGKHYHPCPYDGCDATAGQCCEHCMWGKP